MSETLKSEKMAHILNHISNFVPQMVEIRRDLHAHPELAYEEHRTSKIIADLLKSWGYEVETGLGKTGVVGQLKVGDGTKAVGLRADFDALPLSEMTNLPYSSRYEGKMHACGHDGHTAMLLTAARYLAEAKNFNGTLNLIFQPAEEGYAGAKAMIDDGLFDKFPCDKVFGIHNWPDAPTGFVGSRKGAFMPSSDTVRIQINGKGGHGAVPEKAIDPIAAGAAIITALQTIVSRNVPPLETAVVTVGSFRSGFTSNVIPDSAEMLLTVRCFNAQIRDLLQERIETLVKAQAESFGATADIHYRRMYPCLVNHDDETDFALNVAKEIFGEEKVNTNMVKASGSEDFAYMLEKLPGSYLMIGNGESAPLHNPKYDFNDDLIPLGGCYWSSLAENYLR
ncbi:M20 aminoacylase family protein [Bartonella tamiae]|uniref:Amidohydrolase n=1 Tax=Bartonella tamiae Th239 TaxID=1094558 RepID=J1K1S7_9HYPH|nr:M20 aminoacylase family protein [Bartonella tamiae]EJF91020.1 amidohydrolase [Bartonella tamiae Th239]EJF93315.1 amidohydrolase [Bartonella tamiae Th307]